MEIRSAWLNVVKDTLITEVESVIVILCLADLLCPKHAEAKKKNTKAVKIFILVK